MYLARTTHAGALIDHLVTLYYVKQSNDRLGDIAIVHLVTTVRFIKRQFCISNRPNRFFEADWLMALVVVVLPRKAGPARTCVAASNFDAHGSIGRMPHA
jgi:hypothetical protein